MQIVFDTGAERQELDLAIGNPGATVADLVEALAPGDATVTAIVVGDAVVPVDHDLLECGLHEGVVVSLARHPDRVAGGDRNGPTETR